MIEPQPASTVMAVRDGVAGIEVFLVRRNTDGAFMPDVFVFPGGRVDALDFSPAAFERLSDRPERATPAYVFAAARETFEEAGLLFATGRFDAALLERARLELVSGAQSFATVLSELETTVDVAALTYFSRWITPVGENRRFDTHFFVARSPAEQLARADARETFDGLWIAPHAALARAQAGTLAVIFPTRKHLERLQAFPDVETLLDFARRKPIATVMPEPRDDRDFAVPAELEDAW